MPGYDKHPDYGGTPPRWPFYAVLIVVVAALLWWLAQ